MPNSLLLSAATAYYNGHDLLMDDETYDKLLKEEKDKDPNFNIFNHIVIGKDRSDVKHPYPYTAQAYKNQFKDMDEFLKYKNSSNLVWTYKLDGCSITAYYSDGKLFDILTRSDEEWGKRKFDQLKNKVPQLVDKSVIKIDFEAVCSKEDFGDDIRSNANGLINSCYKQDEVDKYINLIPFKITCKSEVTIDYLDSFKLANLNCKIIMDDQINFDTRYVEVDGKHYPIDGFVGYKNTIDPHEIWKHYSNQNIVTEVTDIEWSYKSTWSWTPKVVYKPIMIEGRTCSRATSNGLDNLRSKKCGIGSKIDIFLANSTIPMVGNVYEESENYNIMTECPYCHSKMDEVQSKLRCSNPYCDKIVNDSMWFFLNSLQFHQQKNYLTDKLNIKDAIKILSEVRDFNPPIENILIALANCIVIERFNKYNLIEKRFIENKDLLLGGNSVYELVSDLLTWNQAEVYKRHSILLDKYVSVLFNKV